MALLNGVSGLVPRFMLAVCGFFQGSYLYYRFPVITNSAQVPIKTTSVTYVRKRLRYAGLMRSSHPSCKNTAPRPLKGFFLPCREVQSSRTTTIQISSYGRQNKQTNKHSLVWILLKILLTKLERKKKLYKVLLWPTIIRSSARTAELLQN